MHQTAAAATKNKNKKNMTGSKTTLLASSVVASLSLIMMFLISYLPMGSAIPVAAANSNNSSNRKKPLAYHGGPLLTGNIKLSLFWYGVFEPIQKAAIGSFIESLNHNGPPNLKPQVSTWWHMVESYQYSVRGRGNGNGKSAKSKSSPAINVHVVREQADTGYSTGKVLIQQQFIPSLVQKATAGLPPNTVAVILADKQVTVQGMCTGQCAVHGIIGETKTPYVIVTDPTNECPGACAWPFHQDDYGNGPSPSPRKRKPVTRPPNGHMGADAMVVNLASGLASAVTNPYNTGFSEGHLGRSNKMVEATTQCPKMFGSETGKLLVNPVNGGSFNAHGVKGTKFLLPAIWDPAARSCWTLL